MSDKRGIAELKELGAGRPAPDAVVALYHEAFATFGTQALWSRSPSAHPTIAQALVVAESLRREGNMRTRPFAARILPCRSLTFKAAFFLRLPRSAPLKATWPAARY